MYAAPLNLDLFFKKVFSNRRVAKRFLEDLLGKKITEIKLLNIENKITDGAVTVKFDFRCKINGQYIVIEMQQKYKIDVVKRFYLYQAVSTALQLETLKPVRSLNRTEKLTPRRTIQA
jgi:predicted transposase/invertase (TIGR01784 family)